MTYKILTKTNKVIYRSAIRSALDPAKRNLRLSPLGGEISSNYLGDKIFIRSSKRPDDIELDSDPSVKRRMVTIDPKDLIGRQFLKDSEEDGQHFRARVVRAVIDKEEDLKKGSEHIKFICEVPNSTVDEILTYNEILDYIAKETQDIENDTEQTYKFRRITAHQGPLHSSDKDYKGSAFNVLVEWESGETTYEPLDLIASDDPVTCAEYAKRHNLLDTAGWKRFRRYAKSEKKLSRASCDQCLSPLGGESTSNVLCDNKRSPSKLKYENFVLVLLEDNPSFKRQMYTYTVKGYTGHPTFRKSFEHTNGTKEDTLWYMLKIKDERKNALDKIDSSSNVQNNMVNKILSYIEVLCQNKRVSG